MNAEMLRALRVVSVERGHDPRDFALVAFGGAGPLHACALAEELDIDAVLVPEAAGVLSALGLVASDERRDRVVSYVCALADAGELPAEGEADLRYRGQSFELTIPLEADLAGAFHRAHEERYGYADPERELELVAVRTAEVTPGPEISPAGDDRTRSTGRCSSSCRARRAGCPPGWSGETNDRRDAACSGDAERRAAGDRQRAPRGRGGDGRRAHPLRVLGEHQGAARLLDGDLRRGGPDDRAGGAHPRPSRRDARRRRGGDGARIPSRARSCILNDPYTGGTHLPDVTLVSRTALGYAVSRAHHADVGGMEPASLPAFSRELYQEGLIIPPTLLDGRGRARSSSRTRATPTSAAATCARRSPRTGLPSGGSTSSARGADESESPPRWTSCTPTRSGWCALRSPGFPTARGRPRMSSRPSKASCTIRATVEIAGDEIRIDFAGTDAQDSYNLNCPMSVTRSACYFVVRCITEPDLPASGGAFAPVIVTAPEGCLVHALPPAAVVAGNTETSSRIVDVLFRALGGRAQGQGTMNNVALGNDRFTYYETIGGGQGACADADGPSAVHVAMSNTLITPVEALELPYPLRVERWHLRIGSGGAGAYRGGDGVVRELRVLEDCRLSVLAERRAHGPHGAEGGEDGAPGRTLVNGEEQPAKVTRQLRAGDVVRIETPGGGGFGP